MLKKFQQWEFLSTVVSSVLNHIELLISIPFQVFQLAEICISVQLIWTIQVLAISGTIWVNDIMFFHKTLYIAINFRLDWAIDNTTLYYKDLEICLCMLISIKILCLDPTFRPLSSILSLFLLLPNDKIRFGTWQHMVYIWVFLSLQTKRLRDRPTTDRFKHSMQKVMVLSVKQRRKLIKIAQPVCMESSNCDIL